VDDPRATYRRLLAKAADPGASPQEQASAREIAGLLEKRFGPDIASPPEPEVDRRIRAKTKADRDLAARIAVQLDIKCLTEIRRSTTGQVIETVRGIFRGPESLAVVAVQLYERHRKRAAEAAEWAALAYVQGAVPVPAGPRSDAAAHSVTPPAWLHPAVAAVYMAGASSRDPVKGLPGGPR
jgi:hypothetical protein